MSDTASWSIGASGEAQRKHPQSLRSVLFGLALVLVVGFCGGTWVYLQETLSISHLLAQPRAGDWASTLSNLETLQRWSLGALFGAAAGGAGFLVAILRELWPPGAL